MEKPNKCTEWNKKSCRNFNETPTEIFVELLTSIMLKDDETALRYCTQILTYEPDNSTVMEFHRLISKKLEIAKNEELETSCDSSDSISSASDSDSSHQETDKMNSSSSSSESSLSSEEANDKENSPFRTPFKKQAASQNQERKTLSKKEPDKSSYPCARALSTSRPTREPSKADGKPKMNYKESSSQKAGGKKIENLSHLPGIVS